MLQLASGSLFSTATGIFSGVSNAVQGSVSGIVSDATNAFKDSATGFVSGVSNVTQAVVGTAAQVADPWLQFVNSIIQAKIDAASQFLSLFNSLGK